MSGFKSYKNSKGKKSLQHSFEMGQITMKGGIHATYKKCKVVDRDTPQINT